MPRPFRPRSPRSAQSTAPPATPPSPPPAPSLDQWIDQIDAINSAADRHHRAIAGFASLLGFVSTHDDLPGHDPIDGWSALAEVLADEGKRIDAGCDRLLAAMMTARADANGGVR
jgi:hypothetical protein